MKALFSILAGTVLLCLAPTTVQADVLRGHLSGLESPDTRVDLRIRFYGQPRPDHSRPDPPLAAQQFDNVPLHGGRFVVTFDADSLPPCAGFVEIDLRPSARPYAAFREIPPRRQLQRLENGNLVAVTTALERIPPPSTRTDPGALE